MTEKLENKGSLREVATPFVALWLVESAQKRNLLTYGEAKERLQDECRISVGYATNLKHIADELMKRFHCVDPSLPLITALLVNKGTKLPGHGFRPFIARHFNKPRLYGEDISSPYYRRMCHKAMEQAFDYGRRWNDAYELTFETALLDDEDDRFKHKGRRGKGGEGRHHQKLRHWVFDNPKEISPKMRVMDKDMEFPLLSGDRVDVVYHAPMTVLAIEVKPKFCGKGEFVRGIYQCVKYRAVLEAQHIDSKHKVDVLLVTEERLPKKQRELADRLKIKHSVHRVN